MAAVIVCGHFAALFCGGVAASMVLTNEVFGLPTPRLITGLSVASQSS